MGESRARTGFGHVDLEVADEPGVGEETSDTFGELDWDFPEPDPQPAPQQTSSTIQPTSKTQPTHQSARETIRRDDAELQAVIGEERQKTPPPSTSGVGATGDRVALMREAYARGDAEGALAIASAMEGATMPPPPGGIDHPDAGVEIEVGGEVEIEIDAEEPVHEKDLTRVVPSGSFPGMRAVAPPPPALPSLTERQCIPRVLVGPSEIAKLPIDHRAGFLLGAIDGMQTMEEILDVCPMPPSEAMDLIRALVDMGVIAIE